jgi:class 3 adenylate cyclase/dihydrofolate reductase
MRLVVTTFMTLDGVVEAPGFDEHRDGRNAWALRIQQAEDEVYNAGQIESAEALLLGRRTWQIWAAFWPTMTGPLADRMNSIPKYVASTTLKHADGNNTTILAGDIREPIERLKAQPGGELVVYGSPGLLDYLLKHDLVDEYRILVYPVILGSGKRLFGDRIDTHHLRLTRSRTFGSGVVLLVFEPAPAAPAAGPYLEAYQWTQEQVRSLEAREEVDRVLATMLFTDVVDSTGMAAAMGDRAWKKLLDQHHEMVRAEVARWHGGSLEFTGDGTLAVFDAPTRALRCAFGLIEALRPLGIRVRAGIHTGEIERREDGLGGIGLHIAARVLGQAGASQVIVTRTARDLATGSDLAFRELGTVTLRGVPGTWELFEASQEPTDPPTRTTNERPPETGDRS